MAKYVNMTQAVMHVGETMLLPGVEAELPEEGVKLAGFKLLLKARDVVPYEAPDAKARAEKVAADKAAADKEAADAAAAEAAKNKTAAPSAAKG